MKRAFIFWFTGLSGSGKTTVALGAKDVLEQKGYSAHIFDGDDVRAKFHISLGFSENDIKKNNTLIMELCKKNQSRYDVILVPIISPYQSSRAQARDIFSPRFCEIYFSASLKTVMARDTKGLYAKAKKNEISNLIGYSPSNVYEPPQNADHVIDTDKESPAESIKNFSEFILNKLENSHGN